MDIQIGIDGSWQKRGYSSLNGVVTAVAKSNRKVVDYQVLTKFCRSCAIWENRKTLKGMKSLLKITFAASTMSNHLELWRLQPHYHSSLNPCNNITFGIHIILEMVIQILFKRLLIPSLMEMSWYLSKPNVLDTSKNDLALVYEKFEIIIKGRSLRMENSGRGRLTDKTINKMQNFYGMSIRQNSISHWNGDRNMALYSMKKSVLAVLWHCSDTTKSEERPVLSSYRRELV